MLLGVPRHVLSKGPGDAADTEMALVGLMNMVFACAPPACCCTRHAAGSLQAQPVVTQCACHACMPGQQQQALTRGGCCRYGGQFAFVEVINAMQRPSEFASAVRASTAVMGVAYVALGGIGYWSMGAVVPSVIIFGIGSGMFARLAANAILAQARPAGRGAGGAALQSRVCRARRIARSSSARWLSSALRLICSAPAAASRCPLL